MKLDELFRKRRSVRRNQNRPVSVEVIRELIKESTFAPNAGNEQLWQYIVKRRETLALVSNID